MSRTPTFLGISMGPQKNRRWFVVFTYAILVACATAVLIVPPWGDRIEAITWVGVIFPIVISSSVSFGKLAEGSMFERLGGKLPGLGLAPRRRGLGEADERDVAIRNAAHHQGFRVVGFYGMVFWLSLVFLRDLSGPTAVLIAVVLGLPLMTMIWTLPQAIIIWTLPDVPEEATVETRQ